ncbi:HBS1-like protein [Termitomyces sp. J132]|nr:HBS1-like protein [Termitomyces sp. J132]
MSRHRHIRNINIQDELNDDALSDGGEEEMTDEQHGLFPNRIEEVRQVIGDEYVSGFPDNELKDVLWEYFFDTEKTIHWALEEQSRRQIARERKEPDEGHSNAEYYHPEQYNIQASVPPRGPLILLHQTPAQALELETPRGVRPALSTISEHTERTETTPRLPPGRKLAPHRSPRPSSTFTASSYGQVIGHTYTPHSDDPNSIPVSPPLSALNELSLFEPAPSITASDSASARPFKVQCREPVPPSEGVSDVSKSNKQSAPPAPSPKQSKLSRLASSRASSISTRSESSRSSGITLTGSVKTFPALRPSPQSLRPPSSNTSSDPPSPRTASTAPGANEEYYNPHTTETSSMTSIVQRAIHTAMELEALDNAATPNIVSVVPIQPIATSASPAFVEAKSPKQPRSSPVVPSALSPALAESSRVYKEVDTFRTPSKLALLAQKSSASKTAKISRPVTEYLTPAANGPTATTAITTSIQTLWSLTDPTRSRVMPALDVVPFGVNSSNPPPSTKGSKLAAKIRRAHEKQNTASQKEEDFITSVSPIFDPDSTALIRASPSAFASLLVDDAVVKDKIQHRSSQYQNKEDTIEPTASTPPVIEYAEKCKHKSRRHKDEGSLVPGFLASSGFKFDGPSPDDIVMNARRGTSAKEREKALKKASGANSTSSSRPSSALSTPTKKKIGLAGKKSGSTTPARGMDPRQLDLSALNLSNDDDDDAKPEEMPHISFAKDKLLEEAKRAIEAEDGNAKKGSTLMGRLLYELGRLEEKMRIANERGSAKVGKSSFSWAWGLDGTTEERERGITMDIALRSLMTPHRQVTILDAPGHKDFIPNMISGASQADCALLVVDAAHGEFEAGFERGGQTREHLLLVRSLGVSQVIVAVNKLDQVDWDKDRKTKFVPVAAMEGVNLVTRDVEAAEALKTWYSGPTLVDLLDMLEPPTRDIMAPLRVPISNVFKSHGSGAAVAGRLCGGVIQVGERLRILPGDEISVVKTIEVDDKNVLWAAAGTNVTLYLTSVDPVNLHIGSVLCPTTDLVPLATSFSARIIVFDIQVKVADIPAKVELFHHSRDVPATVTKLICILDRASGKALKTSPRVLTKGISAEVKISLRSTTLSGSPMVRPVPLETFAANKDMGRILLRRGGETIAAGIVLAIDV